MKEVLAKELCIVYNNSKVYHEEVLALERSVANFAKQMRPFLKRGERVLICLGDEPGSLGELFKQAVLECDAVPVMWGGDLRWKALLRLAFIHKARTIVSVPLVSLGLAKLARAKDTPLYVHNVVTVGYPCLDWMREGIVNCLDCKVWPWDLPEVLDAQWDAMPDQELLRASREIMEWTSVLDCRLAKREGGLEIEIVVFPGEKLPKLPSCAKLKVRPWNPEEDVPFGVYK